jgi:hypothetical protein
MPIAGLGGGERASRGVAVQMAVDPHARLVTVHALEVTMDECSGAEMFDEVDGES